MGEVDVGRVFALPARLRIFVRGIIGEQHLFTAHAIGKALIGTIAPALSEMARSPERATMK